MARLLNTATKGISWEGYKCKTLTRMWQVIISEYSARNITRNADILPALSGCASQMQIDGGKDYLAGIFLDHVPEILLWSAFPNWGSTVTYRPSSEYIAPSFSWASLVGAQVGFEGFGRFIPVSRIELLEASCQLKGENPFGEVVSGFIRLSGALISTDPEREKQPNMARIKGKPFIFFPDTIGDLKTTFGDLMMENSEPKYCLRLIDCLAKTQDGGLYLYKHGTQGLMLAPSRRVPGAYERCGMFRGMDPSVFDREPEREVTIV
ncbi:hypothetical protein H2199_009228 [Coniosporium tulheliwenetii]|uniref:Uncharacterized protein n=1 Tax=Coniosporium tulheliwenetii TaxID=3383036 RepID=A0ACC2YEP8_9PEZI|nr:hypothetical protein H2199_009228 [Cladosporium sp. JES 115]